METNKRLRIIKQILEEIKITKKPIGWRTIQKKYNLKNHHAKSIAQTILDIYRLQINSTPQIILNAPKLRFKPESDLSLFILCSDWHIGEIVTDVEINEYNLEIAFNRALLYLEQTSSLIKQLKPKEIYLLFLGDLVSGVIHQELESQTNIVDQLAVTSYIGSLFIKVINPDKIIGVYGNHGEIRTNTKKKSKNLKNNFDLIAYQMMELITNKEIEKCTTPYYLGTTTIGTIFASHGDYVISYGGIPHYGIYRKQLFIHNLCKAKNLEPPKVTFLGHFHEPQALSQFNEKVFINGTMMGTNEYAFKKGLFSSPSQKIVFTNGNSFGEINISLQTNDGRQIPSEVFEIKRWQ